MRKIVLENYKMYEHIKFGLFHIEFYSDVDIKEGPNSKSDTLLNRVLLVVNKIMRVKRSVSR